MMESVLFIGDLSTVSELAAAFVDVRSKFVTKILWDHGDVPAPAIPSSTWDWIISFKSDLVLSPRQLGLARHGAINIHPAPPRYRGIGGYQLAIRNHDEWYGVTCHHMTERVDAGPIIATRQFRMHAAESAQSLKLRAGFECLSLLGEIVETICGQSPLPMSNETWEGPLNTRRALAEPACKSGRVSVTAPDRR